MLLVGAGLRLRDGKGFIEDENLQYTFRSNKNVASSYLNILVFRYWITYYLLLLPVSLSTSHILTSHILHRLYGVARSLRAMLTL